MLRLYLRFYLALIASLFLFVIATAALWHFTGDSAEQAGVTLGRLVQNILPPAAAPASDQQAALGRLAEGLGGMVGGQMLDLAGEGRFGDREPVDVARLQQMKTGALLRFGCIAGALLGQSSPKEYQALDDYGRALGEAFQIADDLLDVEGDAAALGKQTGQDAALGKTTFVTQLGIDGAKQRVRDLLARADQALSIFGNRGDVLRAAAHFVAERKN
jgi:geranylgeranyl pyrophosphate synthase